MKHQLNRFAFISIFSLYFMIDAAGLTAGGWTDKVPNMATSWLNDIVCADTSGKQLFMVGDNGFFAVSNDEGFSWKESNANTTNHLNSIAVSYQGIDTVLVAVGAQGTILSSKDFGGSWNDNTLLIDDFNTVLFAVSNFWIGGLNGLVFTTDPLGLNPQTGSINGPQVDIHDLVFTPYGIYGIGTLGTTSYVLFDDNLDAIFDVADTLDNAYLKSADYKFGRLYFAGMNIANGQGLVAKMDDLGGFFGPITPYFPTELDAPVSSITGLTEGLDKIFVATDNGNIYESDAGLGFFQPVYQNLEGKAIQDLAVKPGSSIPTIAWGVGTDGLVVRYDFMASDVTPFINGFSSPSQNFLQVHFTSQPEFESIEEGFFVHSSVQGLIPYTADYSPGDSTIVDLFLQKGGAVPGEQFTVIVTDKIKENGTNLPFTRSFDYEIKAISSGGANFEFAAPTGVYTVGSKSSNFVTGFFNEDNIFDVLAVTNDSIYLFPGTPSGEVITPIVQEIPLPLAANTGVAEQVSKLDINLDGLMDLVIFDDQTIQVFIKEPDAAPLPFRPETVHISANMRDVAIFSADQDSTLDLAILNDSLQTRLQIRENSFGFPVNVETGTNWIKFKVADIDADGSQDFVGLTAAGDIQLRHLTHSGHPDLETSLTGPFDNFFLADINDDRSLEVLAVAGDIIHIFNLIPNWSFSEIDVITQSSPSLIKAAVAHDFNNDMFLDVVIGTDAGVLKVFENSGGFFYERPDVERIIDLIPSGFTYGDFDMDATLDLLAFDAERGEFQVIRNLPAADNGPFLANFDSVNVSGNSVYLEWPPYEPSNDLNYYDILRGIDSLSMTTIATSMTNSYLDTTVSPGNIYWYRVDAVDTSGLVTSLTGNLEVKTPFELSGSISGVLADTTVPYLVTGPLEVRQDSLLQIMEGVKLLFEPNADFTVYGKLEVFGSEEHFVSFGPSEFDKLWPGIILSGIVNSDTIFIKWVEVSGALEAIRIENRPVRIDFADLRRNTTAFNVQFPLGYLIARNVMVIQNDLGIETNGNSQADLVNVTIAANLREGLHARDNSQIKVKNAIIWYNNKDNIFSDIKKGSDIRNDSSVDMDLHYSTIDSIQGKFTGIEVSKIPPLFKPIVLDSIEFIPDTMSATVDAGDPADDFNSEPLPNGFRINQGVYGGTPFAMPTYQPNIELKIDTLFLAAFPGETRSGDLVIYNTGNRVLEIYNLELHVAEFNTSDAVPAFILPGDSGRFSLNFLPNDRRTYKDEIFIRNNDPHFPAEGYRLPIRGNGLNRPPQITTTKLINAVQNLAYNDTVRAQDIDGDKITYTPLILPPWMSLSGDNGQLSGIPGNDHVGQNIKVEILATDGFGGRDTLITFIDVANVNDPPRMVTTSLSDAIEDSAYVDTVFAVDIDKDTLEFRPVRVPGWLIVATNGALSGLPTNDDVAAVAPIEIAVTDNFGTFDTLRTAITVINTNDPPEIQPVPDTTAYALIPFSYQVNGIDIDGDSLLFIDDSPLFDIDAKSGLINFTPDLADTGNYKIALSVSDNDVSITEEFNLQVAPTPVIAASVPQVTPGDQIIKLDWKNPLSTFYTGTLITWSDVAPITDASDAVNFIDTTFALDNLVQVQIKNLAIAQTYFITIFNYFDPGFRIYSDPVNITATTFAPRVSFDATRKDNYVPPGDTLYGYIPVKNAGQGTLNFHFSYRSTPLLDRWFAIDTITTKIVPPGGTDSILYSMHPLKSMADIDHIVNLQLLSNDPEQNSIDFSLVLKILFDKFAPRLQIISEPDSLHKFAALQFDFTANDTLDTLNWRIGAATDSLRARYKFVQLTTTGEVVLASANQALLGPVSFYPLDDGLYRFELWVYDPEGNGLVKQAYKKSVLVNASTIGILANRWYLASFPREQNINLNNYFADSTALVYRWDQENLQYKLHTDSLLKPGQGAWILSFRPRKIDIAKFSVQYGSDSTHLPLHRGWNQIGVPAGYHLNMAEVKYLAQDTDVSITLREAINQKYLSPAIYWYRSGLDLDGYEWSIIDTTIVTPWRGYWIKVEQAGTLVYSRQPAFPEARIETNTGVISLADNQSINKPMAGSQWQISLTVRNDKYRDAGNVIGVSSSHATLPIYEPPHLDDYCSAYFLADQGQLTQDLREPFSDLREIKEWQLFVISSRTGKSHTIDWPLWHTENGVYLYIVDHTAEQIIDLSVENQYQFLAAEERRRFTIYATQDPEFSPEIIPAKFRLLQNYPNPFNPVTTIKFGIPTEAEGKLVSLKIFNILGQEVKTLVNGQLKAGYHEITWDATNGHNLPVASGVYFYRLLTEGAHQVRKMVLIR